MKEHSAQKEYEKAQTLLAQIQALSSLGSKKQTLQTPAQVLSDLQKALWLPRLPIRMECFDNSNIQGNEAVASMVVFVDGKPKRSDYRRFRIRTVQGIDDYLTMKEVVRRRYSGSLSGKLPKPDLIVIDGGKGHLSAAKSELDALGFSDWPIISIAKQHEHIFSPGRSNPHVLPPTSAALQLLRHLRDEAHRFAIRYHRLLRSKQTFR
jgi:excinuclease ABC subunit C